MARGGNLAKAQQFYALCSEDQAGTREIAFLHLRDDEELGRILGLAVYTSPDGTVQQRHLERYAERVVNPTSPHDKSEGNLVIEPVSAQELLDATQRGVPSSVFIDGVKVAGSVFAGMLKTELGLPIKQPRHIRRKPPDSLREEYVLSEEQNPKIVGPPMPEHKTQELQKAVGKTISTVEYGVVEGLAGYIHEGEAMVLHFTDGTALSIEIGSNAKNLSYDHSGLKPEDFHTDLIPMWRNRPSPDST